MEPEDGYFPIPPAVKPIVKQTAIAIPIIIFFIFSPVEFRLFLTSRTAKCGPIDFFVKFHYVIDKLGLENAGMCFKMKQALVEHPHNILKLFNNCILTHNEAVAHIHAYFLT